MGGMAGNPDPWANEQPTVAPTPAVAEPQPVMPQPVLPGWSELAPKPVDGASAPEPTPSAPTSNSTETSKPIQRPQSYPFQVGPDVPQVYPPHFQAEADARRRATESHEFALARAMENGGEEAAALRAAKERAPSVVDHLIDGQLAPFHAGAELFKGGVTGFGKGISGVTTFLAVLEQENETAIGARFKDIDAGKSLKPEEVNGPVGDYFFLRLEPATMLEKRAQMREEYERKAAVPLHQRTLYKMGAKVEDWTEIKPGDPRYELFYKIGVEGGKVAMAGTIMYFNPVLGTIIMIGSATGSDTKDAIKDAKDRLGIDLTPEQYIEFNRRGAVRNTITSASPLQLIKSIGGDRIVRVIEGGIAGPWAKASRVGLEMVDSAIGAAGGQVMQNADIRAVYDPARSFGEDVVEKAAAGAFVKGVQIGGRPFTERTIATGRALYREHKKLTSNFYIEPEMAKAERAMYLAVRLEERAKSFQTVDVEKELGVSAAYISPEKLLEMINARHFHDNDVKALGLYDKIASAQASRKDVKLPLNELLNTKSIKPTRILAVIENLRFQEGGPTGREAGEILREPLQRLRAIQNRYEGIQFNATEGSHAFKQIYKEVYESGKLTRAAASRQAARRIEILEERARDMSTKERRETADTIYLRDEYNKTQKLRFDRNSKEARRVEDEAVDARLRELGIVKPGASADGSGTKDAAD